MNIVDETFDKWLSVNYPRVQEYVETTGDKDGWYRQRDLLQGVWRAAIAAFSWKETAKDRLPEEIGNYIVVLQNNHIIHAQYLHIKPNDPTSARIWTAATYGELEQEYEVDFASPIQYSSEDWRRTEEEDFIADSELPYLCSYYYVEGPIKGCYTVMFNPPVKKPTPAQHVNFKLESARVLNEIAMRLTKIVWWRRLDLPGYEYESTDRDN